MKIPVICILALLPAQAQQSEPWRDPTKHQIQLVEVDENVRLETIDWGGSGRLVVLLAGAGNTAHVFDDFAPKLASHCHVYGITRRGYGASSRPASGYDDQRLADDVLHAIDALHLTSPVLAGHSMAGGEMTTLARQHKGRVSGLVYLDALGDPRDWPASDPAYMALARKLPPNPKPAKRYPFPESETHILYEMNPDGTRGKSKTPSAVWNALGAGQVKRDYTGIDVPILAMWDFVRPFKDGNIPADPQERAALEAFANATKAYTDRWVKNLLTSASDVHLIDLNGADHYVFLSHDTQVLKAMENFLKTLP